MSMCIYTNCNSVQKPFSSLAFFTLPKDHRRQLWIENSGNTELATLSESARRVVCQKHFPPRFLRIQFHRTILSRDAVPVKWTESFVEPIELIEIQDDDDVVDDGLQSHESHAPQDEGIKPDNQYDEENEQNEQRDDNNWQLNYETSSRHLTEETEETEEVLELEVDDYDESFQTTDETSDNHIINDETDQNQPINELNRHEKLPHPASCHKAKLETDSPGKRKSMDVDHVASVRIATHSNKRSEEPDESEDTPPDVIVTSSSTSKNEVKASGSLQITNEEDKYFAIALFGMLQRISPQKKAFAKVNILRYLTELEYGVNARLN